MQLFAGDERAGRGVEVAVECSGLVAVFTVAQVLYFDHVGVVLLRILCTCGYIASFRVDGREVVADRCVVLSNAVERGHGAFEFSRVGNGIVGFEFVQYFGVLVCIGQYDHVTPVFRRAAHHRRTADVDVFNRVLQRAIGFGNGGFKRVEVHNQHVDGLNAVLGQCRHVLG